MVKVISLSKAAYEQLSAIKENRSFSETIIGLIEKNKRQDIKKFAGIWSDISDKEMKLIEESLNKKGRSAKDYPNL